MLANIKDLIKMEILLKKDIRISNQYEKDQIDFLYKLISEMNIIDIEPILKENLNSNTKGKYQFLAILRDIFDDYKKADDTKLDLEIGKCKSNCFKNSVVFNVSGNKTKRNFAFVVEKSNDCIDGMHICMDYLTKSDTEKKIDLKLLINSVKKLNKLRNND